jgi:DNA-binding NtrC family response regulator
LGGEVCAGFDSGFDHRLAGRPQQQQMLDAIAADQDEASFRINMRCLDHPEPALARAQRDPAGAIEEPIDLLITDAVMPEMDDPTLIKKVRDEKPDMPVICISGYAEETFRNRLGEDQDIHFLAKPFSLAQLAGKVKEVLDRVSV